MSNDNNTLKPCPFCGGEARELNHTADMGDHWVQCSNCGCEQDSVEEWNTRSESIAITKDQAVDGVTHWMPLPEPPGE